MQSTISIIITSYGNDTWYIQQCLGCIRRWKQSYHEVIVVVHDETPLQRQFLEFCLRIGLIDKLLLAVTGHGHVKGVNLGFQHASGDIVFNICNDMRIGPEIVDICAEKLRADRQLGLIGWHYDWNPDIEGACWRNGKLEYALRRDFDQTSPEELPQGFIEKMENAVWFTGKMFAAMGKKRLICCNGSFLGIRKVDWDHVGGFDEIHFPYHWGDDFLTCAIIDQGLNVSNIPAAYRVGRQPENFLSLNELFWQGKPDKNRNRDDLAWKITTDCPPLNHREQLYLEVQEKTIAANWEIAMSENFPWQFKNSITNRIIPIKRVNDLPHGQRVNLILINQNHFCYSLRNQLKLHGKIIIFNETEPHLGNATIARLGIIHNDPPRLSFTRN